MNLRKKDLNLNPWDEFSKWFNAAKASGSPDPTAMALATVARGGVPSVRMVLMKGFDPSGIVFFTNYESKKSRELNENPWASCVFYWPEIKSQVIVWGSVCKCSQEEAAIYFATRPRMSQLGAWASRQDAPLQSKDILLKKFDDRKKEFENKPIPCPPWWGGWRLKPQVFEFWREGEGRLHDRFCYERQGGGEKNGESWSLTRLSP
jgi:pyridoxamine 5'-phosphate oxidase